MNGQKAFDSRHYYGDWEAFHREWQDGSGALLVLVERKSRYVIIWKLPDRKIATVRSTETHLRWWPTRHTVAHVDNDTSFRMHEEMSEI